MTAIGFKVKQMAKENFDTQTGMYTKDSGKSF